MVQTIYYNFLETGVVLIVEEVYIFPVKTVVYRYAIACGEPHPVEGILRGVVDFVGGESIPQVVMGNFKITGTLRVNGSKRY